MVLSHTNALVRLCATSWSSLSRTQEVGRVSTAGNESTALYVYGGTLGRKDEYASKGAAHDLKGAMNYLAYFRSLAALNPDAQRALPRDVIRVPMQVYHRRIYAIKPVSWLNTAADLLCRRLSIILASAW